MSKMNDLTGQRFNRLSVIERDLTPQNKSDMSHLMKILLSIISQLLLYY